MHRKGSVLISRLLTVEKLESFFQNFPDFPNAFLAGGPADIFVIELTDQVIVNILTPILSSILIRTILTYQT
ncbi:hypothetical protein HanRHA438_Chr05g0207051 [Helianthus annuus]|uniref:Uncharacterized protein n=1 Tax=Helianthus annuus TaxID=4232 RepID=A0A9K3IWX9_HELAN|nr:hypothetical protein HanXRQr2_Chr05g0197521 [Helianthus annuus]KAJ0583391.1 hypothetical protein HanHA89_Chr05g0176011 [Helianthus annuus]KAJ0638813.1 hypothetical protein HanHA300_Chr00c0042g0694611 [Helianthus annuus]KAJ0746126.1 hypothetical protein HanOQP8_Chr05g0173941 [Helianthus annuus]KAJ0749129.1 hypothetical protein HanLR1_Chr05g0166231 [Helianthus annuus]